MDTDVTSPPSAPVAEPAPPVRAPLRLTPLWRALPWLPPLVALIGSLVLTGTPTLDIARYGAYWIAGILVPGILVHRAVRGSRGNLPEDIGFGGATGLVLELAAWAVSAALGLQAFLWLWPVLVIALFVGVPGLRRHWRIADPQPLPLRWSWGVATVLGLIIMWLFSVWAALPLPPATHFYYQDYLYHLSLIHEMTRSMPFQTPQLAGSGTLHYHFLSDAHMASASMVTGVDVPTVLMRLWIGPILIVAALLVAGLARELTGRWWAGPVAAAAGLTAMPLRFNNFGPLVSHPMSMVSPSHTYALPLMLLLASLCVGLLRGDRYRAAWVLLAATAVACAGAKSSVLPVLVPGMGLAVLVTWLVSRKFPVRPTIGLGVLLGGLAVGATVFVGSGAGSLKIQIFSLMRFMGQYNDVVEGEDSLVPGGLIPPALENASAKVWLWILAVFVWALWGQLPRYAGLLQLCLPPLSRSAIERRGGADRGLTRQLWRRRTDPVNWLLGGAVLAGTAGQWAIYHPSGGQTYFMFIVVPLGALLTVRLLVDLLPSGRAWATVLGGLALGAAIVWGIERVFRVPRVHDMRSWATTTAKPLIYLAIIAAVLVPAWLIGRRRLPVLRGRGVAVIVGAILGASIFGFPTVIERPVKAALLDAQRSDPNPTWATTAAEAGAAVWLRDHVGRDDVVATNVHCRPIRTVPFCDSRAYLVTGLGGHRSFVESWAYAGDMLDHHGRYHQPYARQPAPDLGRFDLNERVFSAPTPADVAQLRDTYGVRWLFADTRAGEVSPLLNDYGTVAYADGPVTIYQLR